MKNILFALFAFSSFAGNASESFLMMPYALIYDSLDTSLAENEALFLLDLTSLNPELRDDQLIYSIDNGENQFYDFALGDTLAILTTPGSHFFELYAGNEYRELAFRMDTIQNQHRRLCRLNFSRSYKYDAVKKPILYLYPKESTQVSVNVHPVGDFTFVYPSIEEGWIFECHPDGTLKRNDDTYRYLFWESEQDIPSEIINKKEGAVVSGQGAIQYLETCMQEFGMTSEEQADFITYWGPIMQTKSNLYIYLLFNEVCDAFASLEISPKPTQIGRFYVIWASVPDDYNPSLEPQTVPELQRDGFTVLEWGGAEVSASKIFLEDL
ncbi:MAG: hypothetical protein NXI10_13095 [bacterium]|nr:hypothetical protein [bacterium]